MADRREHFLKALIVSFLISNVGTRDRDGFVSGEAITAEMLKFGFVEEHSRNALRTLATDRLLETPHSHFREIKVDDGVLPDVFYYRATSIGVYHIRFWAGSFSYLDAVSIDTPIFDGAARERVHSLAGSFHIASRFEKAALFKDYLESEWMSSSIASVYFDFPELLRAQARTFSAVRPHI